MSPREARTLADLSKLKRDNRSTKTHWIIVDETHVTIAAQKPGDAATACVNLPKTVFNRWVDWYNGKKP